MAATPGIVVFTGSTPINLELDLCPVAKAVEAGAESEIRLSAL